MEYCTNIKLSFYVDARSRPVFIFYNITTYYTPINLSYHYIFAVSRILLKILRTHHETKVPSMERSYFPLEKEPVACGPVDHTTYLALS